ncbi:hypothetical protein SO802_019587 [Lithocarpus litseifolius]|uniref:RNase H type-1 domain-containing protein n=1 Tax=Lithocarpus litseifolius TaxID=425828 RepID=A0AAW2CP69_9ROSI
MSPGAFGTIAMRKRMNNTHLPLSMVYKDMLERLQEFQYAQDLPATPISLPQLTHWLPPRSPTLKVNFDSAIFHNSQTAGIGMVIRDESGKVVGALFERIPLPHTIDVAEALACRRAVSFAKELGIKSMIVEGDSEKVIEVSHCMALYFEFISFSHQRMNAANADRLPCSHIWVVVKKGKEVFDKGSMWTVGRENIKLMIQATPIAMTGRGKDRLVWMENPRGVFDLKSAYSIVENSDPGPSLAAGWIWKAKTLQKLRPSFGDLQEWLMWNGKMNRSFLPDQPPWKMIYPFAIWNIWKSGNNVVFNRKNPNPRLAADIIAQTREFMYCVCSTRGLTRYIVKEVRWEKPPEGWSKLNTDGSVLGSTGLAGCGGIARDNQGGWVAGFSRRIGLSNSFVAELWGLRDGLILCCNLNITSIILELDAKTIVDIFQNSDYESNVVSPILDDCRQLICRFQRIQFKHCFRQANWCADRLARMATDRNLDFISFESPPVDLVNVMEEDFRGMYMTRLCLEHDVAV